MNATLQTILIITAVGSVGLFLGHITIAGVRIGIAGVLFAGILAGHFGAHVSPELIDFLRDFGLILFVYLIGLQVGPGFVSTFRDEGKVMIPLCIGIVLIGTLIACSFPSLFGFSPEISLGLLAGSTTNTPSLAAAHESLGLGVSDLLGIGYAISYPGAVVGLIATMSLLRIAFGVDLAEENAKFMNGKNGARAGVEKWSIRVENVNFQDITLASLPMLKDLGVVISRIDGRDGMRLATPSSTLHLGDTLLAVGMPDSLQQFELIVGKRSLEDLSAKPSPLMVKQLVVTDPAVSGKAVSELSTVDSSKIRITRIRRGDVEFAATDDVKLTRGDQIRVVGEEKYVEKLAEILGNAPKVLETFNFLPLFVGIALGVAFGLYEVRLPGLPSSIKLGLAGGPLITALFLSRLAHSKHFPTYVPYGANIALRELGMMLFLSAVGLKAGPKFFEALFSSQGATWAVAGFALTVIPLMIMLILARLKFKMNFLLLCGLASGSLTDPPALAFASSLAPHSNAPSIAYATVYPVAMVLRILLIQVAALLLVH